MKKSLSNNKGFSLVELIIVVAIMAVLIGILAPQYLRYVEKSKVTQDENLVEELKTSVETACADPDSKIDEGFTVTVDKDDTVCSLGDGSEDKEFLEMILPSDYREGKLQSRKYTEAVITVAYGDEDGDGIDEPTVTLEMTEVTTD